MDIQRHLMLGTPPTFLPNPSNVPGSTMVITMTLGGSSTEFLWYSIQRPTEVSCARFRHECYVELNIAILIYIGPTYISKSMTPLRLQWHCACYRWGQQSFFQRLFCLTHALGIFKMDSFELLIPTPHVGLQIVL